MVLSRRLLPAVAVIVILGVIAIVWWTRDAGQAGSAEVYVALGASDAVGVGAQRPGREGWVPLVHAALSGNPQLINLGVSGARIDDILAMQTPVAIDAQPRWISLWPGVNDLRNDVHLETFRQQLEQTLNALTQVEDATIILLTIPDLRDLPVFAAEDRDLLDATVQEWNSVIRDAGQRHGALLVDLYTGAPELADNPNYVSADGFHPSSAGYQRIAELVLATLEQRNAALVSS